MHQSSDMKNYLHLDCKGIIPLYPRILEWLEFIATCGYTGIVWEYEDRYPWQTFPGTSRAVYSVDEWQAIWKKCSALNLEIIPLVQTHGHLEWLLKHDKYADWRENGCWNEICPQNKDVVNTIYKWLDEVCLLHPDSEFIHIGGDETWNLASCPHCVKEAKRSGGSLNVYLKHIKRMCEYVIAHGKRPIVWGDVFYRSETPELAATLPDGTVLVDWQYEGKGPWESTDKLLKTSHEVWGASSNKSSFDLKDSLYPIKGRLDNIKGWREQHGKIKAVIGTTWGRARSLLPLYGPWHLSIPGFIAGGTSEEEWSLFEKWYPRIDDALKAVDNSTRKLIDDLSKNELQDSFYRETIDWWIIYLKYQLIKKEIIDRTIDYAQIKGAHNHVIAEHDYINHSRRGHKAVLKKLEDWDCELRNFFEKYKLSDIDEFSETKTEALRSLLKIEDWASEIVDYAEPISRK